MRGDIVLFLGLVTIVGGGIIVAVVIFFGGGGGGSPCDNPLAPLGESEISQLGFQTVDVGLTRVIQAASVGNVEAAEDAFSFANEGAVHNFTHTVDARVAEVDKELAVELCEAIIKIEDELLFDKRTGVIAGQATRIQELMRDAAEALGFARPGG